APVALLPLAEGLFTLYLWWETGDPLAQTHAQARGWGRSLGLPPLVIWNAFTGPVLDRHELRFLVHIVFALVWTAMLVELWRRRSRTSCSPPGAWCCPSPRAASSRPVASACSGSRSSGPWRSSLAARASTRPSRCSRPHSWPA